MSRPHVPTRAGRRPRFALVRLAGWVGQNNSRSKFVESESESEVAGGCGQTREAEAGVRDVRSVQVSTNGVSSCDNSCDNS
jgi:hypothetical protein